MRTNSVPFALVVIFAAVLTGGGFFYYSVKHLPPDATVSGHLSTYRSNLFGVSFDYPGNWILKPGADAWTDATAANTGQQGDYPGIVLEFNFTSLVTLEAPVHAYPGIDYAFLNLSADRQSSALNCFPLTSHNDIGDVGTTTIGGIEFHWVSGFDSGRVYSAYTNGTCYKFNFGDQPSTYEGDDSAVTTVFQRILTSVSFSETALP